MVWPTEYDSKLEEYDAFELPGQQLSAAHAPTPLDHVLNLNLKAPPACVRLTGIIATIGKSCSDLNTMERMIAAGMNIALINMCFGSKEEHIEYIKNLRQAAKNYSVNMGRQYSLCIAVLLAGKKIRTGKIAEMYGEYVELKAGDSVRLTTDETYRERSSMYTVYIDYMHFADQMKKDYIVLLDNESISLRVEIISSTTLTCKVEMGGQLGSYKDVFVPNCEMNMPNYSDRDRMDIDLAMRHQVDILVTTFVESAKCISELRRIVGEKGRKIAIVAKIQTIEGFRNYDHILQIANGIIIARQELGSDINPNKLVVAQKNMIARANKDSYFPITLEFMVGLETMIRIFGINITYQQANVPVSVSAHLLYSMRHQRLPLRSELLDVANCILDGADCLVLSSETAVGQYPVETVACMASACKEAEACMWTRQIFYDLIDKTQLPCDQATGAAVGAVIAAQRCIAAAIVVITATGNSAQIISKYKPRCPVIAVTRYHHVAKHLHLWRGIVPLVYEDQPDVDWQNDIDKRVYSATKWGMEQGFIRSGDPVVIVSGWRQGSGFTNTMRVIYATAESKEKQN